MRTMLSASAAALVLLGFHDAQAEPPDLTTMPQLILPPATPPPQVTLGPLFVYNVTTATDYIFRGVSQTANQMAVFGAARATYDQFYAGIGAENVNFHNGTDVEYDLSAGWTPAIAGFRFVFGVIRYGYINEPAHFHADTVEYNAAALHDFGPLTLGTSINYTANFFGDGHEGAYFEVRAAYRVTRKLSLGGALGRQTVEVGTNHDTWNVGLNYAFIKHFSLDVRYYDTNEHDLGRTYGSHYVAALKASF